jgi:hypothetical protein
MLRFIVPTAAAVLVYTADSSTQETSFKGIVPQNGGQCSQLTFSFLESRTSDESRREKTIYLKCHLKYRCYAMYSTGHL